MATATAEIVPLGLSLEASDVSGQHRVKVVDIRRDSTIGELVRGLVGRMGLPSKDPEGRDVAYHARLEREGRHVHASETVSSALREGDQITLQPDIQAGGA